MIVLPVPTCQYQNCQHTWTCLGGFAFQPVSRRRRPKPQKNARHSSSLLKCTHGESAWANRQEILNCVPNSIIITCIINQDFPIFTSALNTQHGKTWVRGYRNVCDNQMSQLNVGSLRALSCVAG